MPAATFIQAVVKNSAGPTSTQTTGIFPINPTSGNSMLVAVECNTSTNRVTSFSDTAGNSYSMLVEYADATTSDYLAWYWASNIVGGSSFAITANYNTSLGGALICLEYAGLLALDTATTGDQANTGTITSSIINAHDGDLLLALAYNNTASATYSLNTDWQNLQTSTLVDRHVGTAERHVTEGAYAASFIQGVSAQASILLVALKTRNHPNAVGNIGKVFSTSDGVSVTETAN